ncbi:hypothetical protein LXL04_009922 [Taraxacum kok-saghyz]
MGKPPIGIDLGTTYSCVAVWKHDRIEIIPNDQGNRTTLSCVTFIDATCLIGDGAKNQAAMNPTNTIFDAKRLIGRRFSDSQMQDDMKLWPFKVIEGRVNTPKVVVSYKGKTKEFLPEEISSMVLRKMKETAEAYIREPTKKCCDNGGGTFDVSILTIVEDSIKVKAVSGDTHLGGTDFDNRMVDHSKFEELNMSYFDRCMKTVEACLRDAKVKKSKVNEVVVVGGSSRIPKVRCMLQKLFYEKELCESLNPDEAVAYGAARLAEKLTGNSHKRCKDMVLLDVTPLSLGIETQGGIFDVVIPRNTTIPRKIGRAFYALYNHSMVNIKMPAISSVTAEIVSTGKMKKLTITNANGRLSKEEIEKMAKDAHKAKQEDQEYKI